MPGASKVIRLKQRRSPLNGADAAWRWGGGLVLISFMLLLQHLSAKVGFITVAAVFESGFLLFCFFCFFVSSCTVWFSNSSFWSPAAASFFLRRARSSQDLLGSLWCANISTGAGKQKKAESSTVAGLSLCDLLSG